jgi:hypothetical protein
MLDILLIRRFSGDKDILPEAGLMSEPTDDVSSESVDMTVSSDATRQIDSSFSKGKT